MKKLAERVKAEPQLARTVADLHLPHESREVVDKDSDAVLDEIEAIMFQAALSVLDGEGFYFDVPTRSKANQMYVPELDRIVLKSATHRRPFASVQVNQRNHFTALVTVGMCVCALVTDSHSNLQTVKKTTITTRIMQLVHELNIKGIHVTKRDLFYTDVKLFEDQGNSDTALDDVACLLGCTRSSLHVVRCCALVTRSNETQLAANYVLPLALALCRTGDSAGTPRRILTGLWNPLGCL